MGKAQISQASIDENGNSKGGRPGDQTGEETNVRNWYPGMSGGWKELIRCTDAEYGKLAAGYMVKLIGSNLVGYDQNRRNTLYNELEKNGWSVDRYILSGVNTSTDCSAFVFASYCCVIPELRKLVHQSGSYWNSPTCSTSWSVYGQCNGLFERYGNPELLSNDESLIVGDILNIPGKHMVMVCSTDGNVKVSDTIPTTGDDYTQSYSSSERSASSKSNTGVKNTIQCWSAVRQQRNSSGTVLGTHMKQK